MSDNVLLPLIGPCLTGNSADQAAAMDHFQHTIANNPTVAAAARARLADLADSVTQRCFVSRQMKSILEQAITGAPHE